ncbi:hypothetical protein DUNSADRAFT_10181 [Dunaliella salina]|uniref:Prolyl 4-hydroxylase alpha subunit Fe(2+) 2OG dioxygenase domain-containing protein n=1 Tax=Dunaliella salina TaxID=3046 RepID=A0ABQ7GFW5_DUNSA|nr:hypothetical protein DUNSADRAFT_10181 [Dunaliella salina]|eukprot:KAF5833494.1 hypothetical protein DUNSADRAFT_10181 [Dunaliella salina]
MQGQSLLPLRSSTAPLAYTSNHHPYKHTHSKPSCSLRNCLAGAVASSNRACCVTAHASTATSTFSTFCPSCQPRSSRLACSCTGRALSPCLALARAEGEPMVRHMSRGARFRLAAKRGLAEGPSSASIEKGGAQAQVDAGSAKADKEQAETEGQEEDVEVPELSQASHIILVDGFKPDTVAALRGVFDARFADPRATHAERFLWDYWYCPNAAGTCQYNLVRTQASAYFTPELCAELENALLAYGESQLGCRAITPIWMSYYVDGMMQELHCDNPQGPFAYVLSLTNWEARTFRGGETVIAKPRLLDYWSSHNPNEGLEHDSLFTMVPPEFGRLTVFDPRFPHGVQEVHGTRDPREGRLVLHGWFTAPEPFFTGGLSAEQAAPVIDEALEGAIRTLQEGVDDDEDEAPPGIHVTGVWTVQIHVSGKTGEVTRIEVLADTLVALPRAPFLPTEARAMVQQEVAVWLEDARFPIASDGSDSSITLPVVFE